MDAKSAKIAEARARARVDEGLTSMAECSKKLADKLGQIGDSFERYAATQAESAEAFASRMIAHAKDRLAWSETIEARLASVEANQKAILEGLAEVTRTLAILTAPPVKPTPAPAQGKKSEGA